MICRREADEDDRRGGTTRTGTDWGFLAVRTENRRRRRGWRPSSLLRRFHDLNQRASSYEPEGFAAGCAGVMGMVGPSAVEAGVGREANPDRTRSKMALARMGNAALWKAWSSR